MGPKSKLAYLLLQHQGSRSDELERYSTEECSAMLFFLTRYGYLIERSRAHISAVARPRRRNDSVGYVITERGQTLLSSLAEG